MGKEKVFIITRRFRDFPYGIGFKENDACKYDPHPISDDFIEFWAGLFIKNQHLKDNRKLKEIIGNILSTHTEAELTIILDEERSKLKSIFEKVEMINSAAEAEHLTHIFEYVNDNKPTNIFVYRHWLNRNEQGFLTEGKQPFLSALRQNVMKILKERPIEYDASFNWIVHDRDIFYGNRNGVFCLNGKVYDPSLLSSEKEARERITKLLHRDLHNDNIWLFRHEIGESNIFKDVILDFHTQQWTSSSLYNYLTIDSKSCAQRVEENGFLYSDICTIGMLKKIFQRENPYLESKGGITNLEGKTIKNIMEEILRWETT